MTNLRLLRHCACLSLPTIAVCALGIWFLVDKVPEIEKAERDRVKAEYRETARAIRQNPDGGYRVEETLPADWRRHTAGKMSPGRWGYVTMALKDFTWVWYDDGSRVVFTHVPKVCERDYRTMFLIFGPLFLLVLVGMTVVGIRYFVDYVRSRDDFLAATAHDLTTPLVGMRYAIGRSECDARVLNERMLRLVENIKDFMRLGGRRPGPKREPFDLEKACDEAYALFREDYRDLFDGDDVPVEVEGGSSAIGDETLAVQILWNLFGNDLKYAAPFGRVRVRIRSDGKFVKTEFIDEGKGMTPYEMRHAFDRYYRAKTVLESGKGGFGIGLCTAREFARAMGGELSVRANAPRGCVFTLALPAAPDAAPAAGVDIGS